MNGPDSVAAPAWVHALRADVPALARRIDDEAVVYLDNASTTLKPERVLSAIGRYDREVSANIHRGKHALSEEASALFEDARATVARFVGATPRDVVFTMNATMAINLVALGLRFDPGQHVLTTAQEHHSNLLPWQGRAPVKHVDVGPDGAIDVNRLVAAIDSQTRVVAVSLASNITGRIHDLREVIAAAHARGALVCVDAAQAAPHQLVDMRVLAADFVALSGHKMLGPTGIGALVGGRGALEQLSSTVVGGGTPRQVTWNSVVPKSPPFSFEAGTPPIAQAIGLAEAAQLLMEIGRDAALAYERRLAGCLVECVAALPGVELLGPPPGEERLAIASLVPRGDAISADHLAMLLSDRHQVMVRSGTHCCHPFFDGIGRSGALRLSAYLYNTEDEIERATDALRRALVGLQR